LPLTPKPSRRHTNVLSAQQFIFRTGTTTTTTTTTTSKQQQAHTAVFSTVSVWDIRDLQYNIIANYHCKL
jgi:hypothetical protein